MARNLTALKVKIGLTQDGRADNPDFNQLPVVQAANIDWSIYVDRFGEGWQYDQVSGHRDDDLDSPWGQQWGMLLVPQQFVTEAVAAFPTLCASMTEAECQDFWDNRAHVRELTVLRDAEVLRAIADLGSIQLTGTVKSEISTDTSEALDPNHIKSGLRKNHDRFWADHKVKRGVNYV